MSEDICLNLLLLKKLHINNFSESDERGKIKASKRIYFPIQRNEGNQRKK